MVLLPGFGRSVFRGGSRSHGFVLFGLPHKELPVLGHPLPVGPLVFYRKFSMKNNLRAAVAIAIAAGSVLSTAAHAQAVGATAAFGTAVTAVTTDIATYGAALVGVAAVGVGFMVGLKYIKKIRGAA